MWIPRSLCPTRLLMDTEKLVYLYYVPCALGEVAMMKTKLATAEFGATGQKVTTVGLGGEGVLRTYGYEDQARAVIGAAFTEGIRYFDCARAYAGSEGYYGLVWSEHPDNRAQVFQASKSAARDERGAWADLEGTLATMRISHLDLWQIHDVRTQRDLDFIAGPHGALKAFVKAREQGKVRFVGVTGHHDPSIIAAAIQSWPVDAVMIPVNPVEGALGGFLDLIPIAHQKRIAVIGMKVLGASHYILPDLGGTPEMLIRYALSQKVTVVIVGCSSPAEVRTLASTSRNFAPLSPEDQGALVERFRRYARGLAYYRGVI